MKEFDHLSFKSISIIDRGGASLTATLHRVDNIKWLVTKTNRCLFKSKNRIKTR